MQKINEIHNKVIRPEKIIQFGEGGFLRGFADWMIQRINEEGKYIDGLKPEIAIVHSKTKQVLDVVYGNCIFASHNDDGDTIGLDDEQISVVRFKLQNIVTLIDGDGKEYEVRALLV